MEQSFPELEGWRREIREKNRRKPFHFGGEVRRLPAPSPPSSAFRSNELFSAQSHPTQLVVDQKVGRNDQCPCGSGKKYKKCCINKGN
ncbi:MAG: SEC-C domain-containing protein [Planctomycetaceae bacterium]|nr:SEC-C domain-containing protein [Planctomycetaceae bacterium]